MRSRLLVRLAILATLAAPAALAHAQDGALADGLIPGDYIRVSAGIISPYHPAGSLRTWDRGKTATLSWENWQQGSNGVGRVGFALGLDYSRLPLNETQFLADFQPVGGGRATSATADDAQMFALSTIVRVRFPSPIAMPWLQLGFGVLNYRPGTIVYVAPGGAATAKQQNRTGGSVSVGGGLDKQVYGRAALFGEAGYTYAFTSIGGRGIATPGGVCSASGCDALKNTSIGTLRGGLRVRITR